MNNSLYSSAEIRELEQLAAKKYGLTSEILMARAGSAAWQHIKSKWPSIDTITILCGGGNNGGDGYVLASIARASGCVVKIFHTGDPTTLSNSALNARLACERANIPMLSLDEFTSADLELDLIVDALLGIGLKGQVKTELQKIIALVNTSNKPIVAIDVPSGINADTGAVMGQAICATMTVTFLGMKSGLLTGAAVRHCGELILDKLDLPDALIAAVKTQIKKIDYRTSPLKARMRDAHKGSFGHVLVVGGDSGMPGAVRICAEAALRVGAGLVTVATRPQHVNAIVSSRPEIMCHGIEKISDLKLLLEKVNVVALGSGLGTSNWSQSLFAAVMKYTGALIIDADALNLLAATPIKHKNWILTPHPGEAGRLLKQDSNVINADRFSAVHNLQQKYGGTIVLKGAGTLVMDLHGKISLCQAGNPGMASGGMGDLLTGTIAGLLAQELSADEAAKYGVYIHALAGDETAAKYGERGLLATDMLPMLRRLVNE